MSGQGNQNRVPSGKPNGGQYAWGLPAGATVNNSESLSLFDDDSPAVPVPSGNPAPDYTTMASEATRLVQEKYPLNSNHVPPAGLLVSQHGAYPMEADSTVVAKLRRASTRFIVVDIETTGLDPNRAQTTEIAWECLNSGDAGSFLSPHTLDGADPKALEISRYHERLAGKPQAGEEQVRALHAFLGGDGIQTFIVGSNPSFDCSHLNTLFVKYGLSQDPWHHRKIDPAAAAYWMYEEVPLGEMTGLKESTKLTGVTLEGHHAAGVDVTATTRIWHALEHKRIENKNRFAPPF